MEIINTIWNALTTENELLVKIVNIPLVFIEMYVSLLIFTTVLNINANKKQKILYVIILGIIGLLDAWIIPLPYNTFVNIIACPILVYFVFKTNILKAILSEIFPYIVFVIIGALTLNIGVHLSNIPSDIFLRIPITKFVCSLFMYLLAYLFYRLCRRFNININIITNLRIKNKFILIINILIGILSIALQSYLITTYSHFIPVYIAIISLFVLLVYFLLSMYSLIRTSKLEVTTERLEEEKLYNKTMTIMYDNIRGFKHNFNNTVQALNGYISTNNMEGLKKYFKDLLNDSQKINNLSILNPALINNPAIYSILTSKYYEAEKHEIKMNLEIFLDMENLNIKTYDLTTILGILLDNALEASNKSEEKEINVIIRKDNKANRDLFIIENTYSNKDIDVDRIFEKGYTSKEDKDTQSHGLGLWNVRKIIKKYGNLNLFTTKNNKLFKQQLEIYF